MFSVQTPKGFTHWYPPTGIHPLVFTHWYSPTGIYPLVFTHWYPPTGIHPLRSRWHERARASASIWMMCNEHRLVCMLFKGWCALWAVVRARNYSSTSTRSWGITKKHASAFHGQRFSCAHCSTPRCPSHAAFVHVFSSHGQPLARAHCRISRCPCHAALEHVSAAQG